MDHARDTFSHAMQAALLRGALPGEADGFDDEAALNAAQFLTATATSRPDGAPAIAIDTAHVAPAKNGHKNAVMRRMRIAIVNDDMPFLVDSIGNCLARNGLVIHRLLHPVIGVKRDDAGRLDALCAPDTPGEKRESMIFLETDRTGAKDRARLHAELALTLDHVRAAVADWPMMQRVLADDADRCPDDEGAALLRWLLARNMTQTGHMRVARTGVAHDALGICRVPGEPLLAPASVQAAFEWFEHGGRTPLVAKSNRHSRVHRDSLIDLFITPVREGKDITALSIHAGLWTSAALSAPPDKVPVLRASLSALMDKYGFDPGGHAGKALFHALTTLPHDVVISFDRACIERLALNVMSLSDRPRPRLVLASAALDRHLYAFVWLPRDEVSTARRMAIQDMLVTAANAPVLSWSIALEEGGLALLRLTLDLRDGGTMPDEALLDRQLHHMVRGWAPAVEAALADIEEAGRAATLTERYAHGFPQGYRVGAGPEEAALDILELHALDGAQDRRARLYRNPGDAADMLRVKLYSHGHIALSDAVPALENFGFRAMEEVATPVDQGRMGHIHRILIARRDGGDAQDLIARDDIICDTLARVMTGQAEDDRFNELIVSANLSPDEAGLLRALFRYMRQAGSPYTLGSVVDALRRNAAVTRLLIVLFRAMHDPAEGEAGAKTDDASAAITAALADVSAIDEDRIIRQYRAVITACLRTNFFAPAGQDALAFKFDSAAVPGLPKPLPWREIFVYSRRVEGIHLRAGPVARGGLRWSDRRDDFRTEVLGLMKAQRVKNAVIVPTGAKGGFYPKLLPDPAVDRDAWLAEGTESYRIFIRALLSVTDNIVAGTVTHPESVRVRDEPDPYFVVAADKGTATFSDIANAIAIEAGFWLGDAFASGGSNGYDHKAMGITARGAWLSVQRHFAEMGVDVQNEPVRVVGCGDMSGDVFGNGMLLSKAVKLVAAFDHRHIFLDPDPDPAASWAERARLFALPRSSWADYDTALISTGGGVFARSMKSIPLSPHIRAMLDIDADEADPVTLIRAILQSRADLLWFGGIGTYVKAAHQNNAQVGDPANDALRVDAEGLRVHVVGEGANLGVTQAGRIAFGLAGGRINTDFIDNSAGVDCSDNEVNIKIALNGEVATGRLGQDDRNALLRNMTDDVAHLVLDDNRLQALGLSVAQASGAQGVSAYIRLIETFEASGRLDRAVEGLAPNEELQRRAHEGAGMTRPELAVLLSTAKLSLQDAIEQGSLGDDPDMDEELVAAFPPSMRAHHREAIRTHSLRREIIATKIANRIINRIGILHPFELAEEEGCTLTEMASACVAVERIFGLRQLWDDCDAAHMGETARITLLTHIAGATRALVADLLRNMPRNISPREAVAILCDPLALLQAAGPAGEQERNSIAETRAALIAAGAPADLAERTSALCGLDGAIGLAQLAGRLGVESSTVAHAFAALGSASGIDWIYAAAERLFPADPWERVLLSGVTRDLRAMRLALLGRIGGDLLSGTQDWLAAHKEPIDRIEQMIARARASGVPTPAMLAEFSNQARGVFSA